MRTQTASCEILSRNDGSTSAPLNWGTGKCDLTDEQADEQERRQKISDRSADEEVARRRHEHFENWRNTPLEPAARSALGDTSPEVAWTELIDLIFGAIDESYSQALEIAKQMGLGIDFGIDTDLEDICLLLSNLNPVEAMNQFNYVNPEIKLSDVARKIRPLEALTGVLRILATSERPIPRNQWRTYY